MSNREQSLRDALEAIANVAQDWLVSESDVAADDLLVAIRDTARLALGVPVFDRETDIAYDLADDEDNE